MTKEEAKKRAEVLDVLLHQVKAEELALLADCSAAGLLLAEATAGPVSAMVDLVSPRERPAGASPYREKLRGAMADFDLAQERLRSKTRERGLIAEELEAAIVEANRDQAPEVLREVPGATVPWASAEPPADDGGEGGGR